MRFTSLSALTVSVSFLAVACSSDDASDAPPLSGVPGPVESVTNDLQPDPSEGTPNSEGLSGDLPLENGGTDCQVPELPAAEALEPISGLPDPFLGLNGERLTSRDQWQCRREEIRRLAERFVYGEKPPAPESVTGSVTAESVTVEVQNGDASTSFSVPVSLPPDTEGPVPVVIGYGGASFEDILAEEGIAYINYDNFQIGDEAAGRTTKQGRFYEANPSFGSTGMLVAWAWGVSRIIDVIEQSDAGILNVQSVGVTGCSRNGKGAFVAGAFDERVALTMPVESGTMGVPAFRLIPVEGGESLGQAHGYRPWSGDAFGEFTQDPTLLPVDTHEVVGLVAPRGLFVMGNPHINNLNPRSEHVAILAGAEIYGALGARDAITYVSTISDGAHCSPFKPEYEDALRQNVRRFLKGDETATTGNIDAAANATGSLSDNVDWEAPTLE